VWKILQEKVYKTSVTDLELSMTPLTNGCHNEDMIQLGPLRSLSLFQFVQINDAHFVHIFFQLDSNLAIWRLQMRWFNSFGAE